MSLLILLLFPVTCALVGYSIRKIIYISEKKHLFDEPTETRKIHLTKTPNLGGVAIFATMIFVSCLFLPSLHVEGIRYICACSILLFFLGVTDDLVGIDPFKKMMAQVIVALLLTIPGDIRITGFPGLGELPYTVSVAFSVLFILLVINAFNLIDGINCLAGGIGLLNCIVFAFLFWHMHQEGYFFLCVSLAGCLTGFLLFNRTPARIFMGDTGSLFLGFLIAVLAIRFIGLNASPATRVITGVSGASGMTAVLALLMIPIYDTLRVFFLRIRRGKSPFTADKNHIHHLLLELRLSHMQATGILLLVNAATLLFAFATGELPLLFQLLIIISFVMVMNRILVKAVVRQRSVLKKQEEYPVLEAALVFPVELPVE
jgi:UDP-N-acetylmuramyl pentapeptide phosphotransferase/UDP-N-acetylglucosamine-1-phosphate transferase